MSQWKRDLSIVITAATLMVLWLIRDWLRTRRFRKEWDERGADRDSKEPTK